MKLVLIAAALALTGSAAVAQPDYPPCTHPGQDRCRQVAMPMDRPLHHHWHHHWRHHHMRRHHHH